MTTDPIVDLAAKAHREIWRMTGNESSGDKLAKSVTEAWQAKVKALGSQYEAEYRVGPHLRERIDVVDVRNGVAYELKVSPNNAHFEFYRDIFKVLACRKHQLNSLTRFVFIVPKSAADKLSKGLGAEAIKQREAFPFTIEVAAI